MKPLAPPCLPTLPVLWVHFGKWHMNSGSPADHGHDQHDGPTSILEGNAGEPDPKPAR